MTKKLRLEGHRPAPRVVAGVRRDGGNMSIWLSEPFALNIAIESRIETLRGRRVRRIKSRLARRN